LDLTARSKRRKKDLSRSFFSVRRKRRGCKKKQLDSQNTDSGRDSRPTIRTWGEKKRANLFFFKALREKRKKERQIRPSEAKNGSEKKTEFNRGKPRKRREKEGKVTFYSFFVKGGKEKEGENSARLVTNARKLRNHGFPGTSY